MNRKLIEYVRKVLFELHKEINFWHDRGSGDFEIGQIRGLQRAQYILVCMLSDESDISEFVVKQKK